MAVQSDDKEKVVLVLQTENAMKEDGDAEWALLDSLAGKGFFPITIMRSG